MATLINFILFLLFWAAVWRIFQKMGREGWEGLIPFYNAFRIFDYIYGNGWKFLFLLIPLVNIYFIFKTSMELARRMGRPSVFGVGMVFLPGVFWPLLAFWDELDNLINHKGAKTVHWESVPDDEPRQEPTKDAPKHEEPKYEAPKYEEPKYEEPKYEEPRSTMSADEAAEKLQGYQKLLDAGLLTPEEFAAKKAELLKKL